jgi:hypothetical protein
MKYADDEIMKDLYLIWQSTFPISLQRNFRAGEIRILKGSFCIFENWEE